MSSRKRGGKSSGATPNFTPTMANFPSSTPSSPAPFSPTTFGSHSVPSSPAQSSFSNFPPSSPIQTPGSPGLTRTTSDLTPHSPLVATAPVLKRTESAPGIDSSQFFGTPSSNPIFSFGSPSFSGSSFGGSTAAETTKQNTSTFSFGSTASDSSKQAPSAFSFGSSAVDATKQTLPAFSFGSAATDTSKPSSTLFGPLSTAGTSQPSQSFTFGGNNNSGSPKTANAPSFSFGTPPSAAPPSPSTFTFNTSSTGASGSSMQASSTATTAPTSTTLFSSSSKAPMLTSSFGTPATSQSGSSTAPTLTFGTKPTAGVPESSKPATTSTSPFVFGPKSTETADSSKTTAPSHSLFNFGAQTPTAAKNNSGTTDDSKSTTQFPNFGGQSSTQTSVPSTPTSNPPMFSFGKASEAAGSPASLSFSPTTSQAPVSTPLFSFGVAPLNSPSSEKPKFTFGTNSSKDQAKATTTASSAETTKAPTATSAPASTPATATTPSFVFGASNNSKTGTTASSGTTSSSMPAFTFGTPKATTSATSTSTAPAFTFGTNKSSHSSSSASTPTLNFGTSKPESSTTGASFNIGATPTKPNAFSFAKIFEDMTKNATQPLGQRNTLLPIPSQPGTQQNQIIQTNFPTHNILPSTQYSVLPEEARKQLDEVAQYMQNEKQRCEAIKKRNATQTKGLMVSTHNNTVLLSQQLDAFSSSLKGQMEAIEGLFETVKDQHRHIADGIAIIDACRQLQPGRAPSWLYSYGTDDDYFIKLAGQMQTKLEQFRKCIWEIERTAATWTSNGTQSPQDIALILQMQKQTLLALANRVAALHENLKMEKELYTRFTNITIA